MLGSASEKRVGIVNGRTSQVTTWTYQLMPKAAGDFTLPPVRVDGRRRIRLRLRVTAPDTSSKAPSDIFMELDAQPSTVYAQSQVMFTLRLFVGVATGRATLTQPEVTGGEAIVEKLGEDATYQTERAGRTFLVRERRYAMFPQAGGHADDRARYVRGDGDSRSRLFARRRFRSGSLDVQVQPAVPPPAAFPDAAWLPAQRVTLTDKWNDESSDLPVGIPRTREVAIEADGLLETQLPELTLPEQPGIRQYADQPELVREITPQGFKAARRVSMAVIAQTPGDVALPKSSCRGGTWRRNAGRSPLCRNARCASRRAARSRHRPGARRRDGRGAGRRTRERRVARGERAVRARLARHGAALVALVTSGRGRAGTPGARARLRGAQTARAQSAARSRGRVRRERRGRRAARAARVGGRAVSGRAAAQPRRARVRAQRCAAREVLDLEAHIYGAAPGRGMGALCGVRSQTSTQVATGNQQTEEPLLPLYR